MKTIIGVLKILLFAAAFFARTELALSFRDIQSAARPLQGSEKYARIKTQFLPKGPAYYKFQRTNFVVFILALAMISLLAAFIRYIGVR